ncbi:MAG: hypothetical protein WCO69_00050 [Candidatus Omnitrophota bacterium]
MLKNFRSKKGQAVSGEYVLAAILMVGALSVMTVYLRRAFQARVYDGQRKIMADASAALGTKVRAEYEPYYTMTSSRTNSSKADRSRGIAGGEINRTMESESGTFYVSNQLQPGLSQ